MQNHIKELLLSMRSLNASIIISITSTDCDKYTFLQALLVFQRFTGCDSTRSFAGKSKSKSLSLLSSNENYIYGFSQVGTFHTVTEGIARISGKLVGEVCGKKQQLQICQLIKLATTSILRKMGEYHLR